MKPDVTVKTHDTETPICITVRAYGEMSRPSSGKLISVEIFLLR